MTRFEKTIAMIDAANAADPNRVQHCDGTERPAELVYGERMSAMLDQFDPMRPNCCGLPPAPSTSAAGPCRGRTTRWTAPAIIAGATT